MGHQENNRAMSSYSMSRHRGQTEDGSPVMKGNRSYRQIYPDLDKENREIDQKLDKIAKKFENSKRVYDKELENRLQPISTHLQRIKEALETYQKVNEYPNINMDMIKKVEKARKNRKRQLERKSHNARQYIEQAINTSKYV